MNTLRNHIGQAFLCLALCTPALFTLNSCMYPGDELEILSSEDLPVIEELNYEAIGVGSVRFEVTCSNLQAAIKSATLSYATSSYLEHSDEDWTTIEATQEGDIFVATVTQMENGTYDLRFELQLDNGQSVSKDFSGNIKVKTLQDAVKEVKVTGKPGIMAYSLSADLSAVRSSISDAAFYYATSAYTDLDKCTRAESKWDGNILTAELKELTGSQYYGYLVLTGLDGNTVSSSRFDIKVATSLADLVKQIEVKRTPGYHETIFTADLSSLPGSNYTATFYHGSTTYNRQEASCSFESNILKTRIYGITNASYYVWLCVTMDDKTYYGDQVQVEFENAQPLVNAISIKKTPTLNGCTVEADISSLPEGSEASFYYGTYSSTGSSKPAETTQTGKIIKATFTNLSQTTYIWVHVAINGVEIFGNRDMLTTLKPTDLLPTSISIQQRNLGFDLSADLTALKAENPDRVYFTYGTSSLSSNQSEVSSTWKGNTLVAEIRDLKSNQNYYFSIAVEVDGQTTYKSCGSSYSRSYEYLMQNATPQCNTEYTMCTVTCQPPIPTDDVQSYFFQYKKASNDVWHNLEAKLQNGSYTATLTGMTTATSYQFRLGINTKDGSTYYSNTRSTTTLTEIFSLNNNDITREDKELSCYRYTIKPSTLKVESVKKVTVERRTSTNLNTTSEKNITGVATYDAQTGLIIASVPKPENESDVPYLFVTIESSTGNTFSRYVRVN